MKVVVKKPSLLDKALKRYERRITGLKAIQEILADDPGFAGELAKMLDSCTNGRSSAPSVGPAGPTTHYGAIRNYFKGNGNKWRTASRIREDTGLPRGAVGQILYRAHPKSFEHKANPKRQGGKLWRMKLSE